jgi:hypothetical protein
VEVAVRTVSKQFASVFFAGFIALAVALGFGGMSGNLLSDHPFLVALRYLGLGLMAAGMTLWILTRRDEAGKPALNALFGMLLIVGAAFLVIGLIYPDTAGEIISPAGLGFMVGALAIGVLSMILAPAYPKPLTVIWPEGGEKHPDPHIPAQETHRVEGHPVEADDLTKIEGIGPKIESILNQSGIDTYMELAQQSPESLRELLKSVHLTAPVDPSSWSRQAELAAKGDWEGLKALKKELSAGRRAH